MRTKESDQPLIYRFPATQAPREIPVPDREAEEGEAACFVHAGRRAVDACGHCGRFTCSLCRAPVGDKVLCPDCLGRAAQGTGLLIGTGFRYDVLAWWLALAPIVFFPFFSLSVFTSPLALFIVIFRWRKPVSQAPIRRTGLLLAGLFALGQIGLWAAGIYYIIYQIVTS